MSTEVQIPRPKHKNYAQQLAALSERMAAPVVVEDKHARSVNNPFRYEAVGHQLFRKLVEYPSEINLHRAGIEHGFLVCARIAMWGVKSYGEQVQGPSNPGSVEDYSSILHRSYVSAVTPFSNINHDVNKVLELHFQLLRGYDPEADTPFDIAKDSSGELVLVPSPTVMEAAIADVWRQDIPFNKDRCAAAGKMLMAVWAATIDTCASPDNPHLFAHDIATAQYSNSGLVTSSV